jgi:chromosome segregation ATPase
MVPAHSGGTGVGLDENTTRLLLVELENKSRELENLRAQLRMAADRAENFAKLQEINAKLAENKMQQEALKETLKRTPANTGELSAQELKKLLDDERLARLRLEYEIRDRDDDLADDRQKIADLRTQNLDLRQDLRQAQGNVQTLTGKLVDANKQLADSSKLQAQAEARAAQTSEQLAVSRAELAETGAKLGAANAELSKAAEELRALSGKVGHLGDDNQKLRSGNAYLSGQLTTATRNLAEVRGQMENANTKISQLQLALDTTDRQKRDLQGHFRQAVTELSETKVELEKIRDNNTELQSKAAAVTAELVARDRGIDFLVFVDTQ